MECRRTRLAPQRPHQLGGTSLAGQKPDAGFIWSIANLLRGPYKPKEYGEVVLPMTILRRLDCVLAPTKDAVHAEWIAARDKTNKDLLDVRLRKRSGYTFYNSSQYTLPSLTGDSANVKANLLSLHRRVQRQHPRRVHPLRLRGPDPAP